MLIIDKTITNTLYLTLSELQTAPTAEYQFVFTNRATKDVLTKVLENISDKDNYQKFEIDGSEFDDYNTGLWSYEVKAYVNNAPVGDILENGFADVRNGSTFNPVGYNEQNNQFRTYNG